MGKKLFVAFLIIGLIMFFMPQRIKLIIGRYPGFILMWPIHYLNNIIGKIKVKNQELEKLNLLVSELTLENARLREELSALKQESITNLSKNLVVAQVIGRDQETMVRYLVINKGSTHRIKKDLPVITPLGIVGKVLDCNPFNAIVETALSPQLKISAINLRSKVVGVIEYDHRHLLRFKYAFAESDIVVGDTIVTSGLGGTFPRGLKIGVVRNIKPDPTKFFQYVEVTPTNNFTTLDNVLVLLEELPTEKINLPRAKASKIQEVQIEIPATPRIR
ncbi:MAG: rod shape-determining protein MreC [candidate division WOR-3 bacterium]